MSGERSPTARALLALEVVQASPGITAERLGERLGVSERAARRYVGILREAGIPIDAVRGPYGGYRVGRGLRLPPLTFTSTEALGLVMAVLDGHHDAGDATDPVGSALGKLVRALPEHVAAQAETVRRAAAPAPDHAAARPDPSRTATLVQACSDHRVVRVAYRSEAGSEWVVEAEPWAVVVRHSRWYLLCAVLPSQSLRTYRLDRMGDVELLDPTFEPPADLDAVAVLEEQLAVGWEHAVDVVVDAPAATVRRRLPRSLGRVEAIDDGSSRLIASTSNPYWYAEQLAVLRAPFRVGGCDHLRAAMADLGARFTAAGGVALSAPEPQGSRSAVPHGDAS